MSIVNYAIYNESNSDAWCFKRALFEYFHDEQIGTRRVDFLVEGVVSVELKALIKLEDVHFAQAINYLEAYYLEIGLLLNFGARSLEYKRLTNKNIHHKNHNHQLNHSSDNGKTWN